MGTALEDLGDVRRRASDLGFEPIGDIALLPRGFESGEGVDDLSFDAETATLRKLLAESGVNVQQPRMVEGATEVHVEKSAAWVAPLIFIGARMLVEAPETISLLLAVLEQFVIRVTRGLHNPSVKLTFALETEEGKEYKRLSYEGPPQAIKEVEELIKGISNGQDSL